MLKKFLAILVILSLLISVSNTAFCAVPPSPPSFKVIGYVFSDADTSAVQYSKMTHVIYAFARPTATGGYNIDNPSNFASLVSKARENGKKVFLAIGGGQQASTDNFAAFAANPSYRTAFVNQCISTIEEYNLDGIDMDWEFPAGGDNPANFAALISELGTAIHNKGKLLTAAVNAYGPNANCILSETFSSFDWLNIMCYDKGSDPATKANYQVATTGMQYWADRGVPSGKLVLGVPFYSTPNYIKYKNLVANDPQAPNKDSSTYNGVVEYYNGLNTITAKTNLALSLNAGGVMVWESMSDTTDESTSLFSAINAAIADYKVEVIFNKDAKKAATIKVEEKDNIKTTTVTLDAAAVKENLDKMDKADPSGKDKKLIIPVNNNSDVVVGELNGQTVKDMEDKGVVLELKTENASYTLSAADININDVSSQMGKQIELKDVKVSVRIAKASSATATLVADTAKKNSYSVVAKPVEFEITCTSGTKTVNVTKFNSYVQRTIAIPDGINPGKITTGVVLNSDGSFSHVPTTIVLINGKYYAKINSRTNSTYTVIWNPIAFKDVENHWSKDYVNDIGSRLIDSGAGNGNFAPDRAITRDEFASMIVKALGLKGTDFSDKFSDVKKSDPYYKDIYTAYEYDIIVGYSNGKFGTQDLITREQAMIMIKKAMKIAGMDESISETEIISQLSRFKDSGDISSSSKQAAAICIKYEIFGGNKGMLTPKGNITRAESATIIVKLLKKSSLI